MMDLIIRVRFLTVTVILLVTSRFALATLIDSSPVTLDLHDQRAVAAAACSKPRGVEGEHFDAYHVRGNAEGRISAAVRCVAHDSMAGNPVKHFSFCEKKHNGWRCDEGADYVEYRNSSTVVYLVTKAGVDTETQIRIVKSLLEGNWDGSRDFRADFNENQCRMRLQKPGLYKFECGLVAVEVLEECHYNNCRYEPGQVNVAIP